MALNIAISTTQKMRLVKDLWAKADAGPKKDACMKHYVAAEKAHAAYHDAECIRELDAATLALA